MRLPIKGGMLNSTMKKGEWHLYINVRETRRANQKGKIQRHMQHWKVDTEQTKKNHTITQKCKKMNKMDPPV